MFVYTGPGNNYLNSNIPDFFEGGLWNGKFVGDDRVLRGDVEEGKTGEGDGRSTIRLL